MPGSDNSACVLVGDAESLPINGGYQTVLGRVVLLASSLACYPAFAQTPAFTSLEIRARRMDVAAGYQSRRERLPARKARCRIPPVRFSLFDTLQGQLGLKVETRKVMAPVLVVDHVNATPTEN